MFKIYTLLSEFISRNLLYLRNDECSAGLVFHACSIDKMSPNKIVHLPTPFKPSKRSTLGSSWALERLYTNYYKLIGQKKGFSRIFSSQSHGQHKFGFIIWPSEHEGLTY